jgi:hypothetical protein
MPDSREEQTLPRPPSPESIARGYEVSDAGTRGLFLFIIFFLLTAIAIHVLVWMLLKYYVSLPRAVDEPKSSVPMVDRFTGPNLQPSLQDNRLPQQDMRNLRDADAKVFNRMGWKTDPRTGNPTIPQDIVDQLSRRYAGQSTTRPTTQEGSK